MAKRPQLKVIPDGLSFVCDEVLEYDVPGLEFDMPPVVVDLGANIGAFAVMAQERWPGAQVTCFEPHPRCLDALKQNVEAAWIDGRAVLGGVPAPFVQMRQGPNLACSSMVDTGLVTVAGEGPIVPTLGAEYLGACDILKVDVEGVELGILRDYRHLATCQAVFVEVHFTKEREEIGRILRAAGLVLYDEQPPGEGCWVQRWLSPAKMAQVGGPKRRPHLFLTVLGWKLSPGHAQSREMLRVRCLEVGVDLTIHADLTSGVDRARNISVELARAQCPQFTHFMFIDSDISFEPDDILLMMAMGYDVVGGAYPKKHVNMARVAEAVRQGVPDEKLGEHACDFVVNLPKPFTGKGQVIGAGQRFLEVEELGTGFLMFTRDMLERYIAHWKDELAYITDYQPFGVVHHQVFHCEHDPESELEASKRMLCHVAECLHQRMARGEAINAETSAILTAANRYGRALANRPASLGRYLTEDYSFCRRWRMMGGKVWLFLDARLRHQGPTVFEGHIGHDFATKKVEAAE